jgi:hypothetical protein
MRSTSYPPPPTRAGGWRCVINAIAIVACSVLFVLAAAGTARAAVTGSHAAPTAISLTDPMAVATNVNAAAISAAGGASTARSIPLQPSLHRVDDACPVEPEAWLDDDDDDDDDDEGVARHGARSRRSAVSVEEALGRRRPSRWLGGSFVPDGNLPVNLLLSESVRRM